MGGEGWGGAPRCVAPEARLGQGGSRHPPIARRLSVCRAQGLNALPGVQLAGENYALLNTAHAMFRKASKLAARGR